MPKPESARRDLLFVLALALGKLLFHVATNGAYGFHRDELATLSDARHLAWGYVAYPPLTPFVGRIALTLFGTSLSGFRFFAALAMSLVVVLSALMARRLGGGRAAMLIAAGAVTIAPLPLAASSLLQYVAFDALWVVLLAYLMIRLIGSGDARWWIAIGVTIGLGVLTKYTMAFFAAGVVAGVLFTPLRRHLRSPWLWGGALLSIAMAAPHFLWQWQHHWITLDFLQSIHARDVRIGRTSAFYREQLFIPASPLTVPLWAAGLVALVADRRLHRYRPLAWMALVPFVLFAAAQGRGYYTAPIYPMLLAAGAVWLERALAPRSATVRRYAWGVATLLLVAGSGIAVLLLPIAPLGSPLAVRAMQRNSDLREEVGWPELAAEVRRIGATLSPAERSHAAVFCGNYGEAGALELYGTGGLPLFASVNSFWLRGVPEPPPETVIVLGAERAQLARMFDSVELAGHVTNRFGIRNEEATEHPDVYICRNIHIPWRQLWPRIRGFG